MQVVSLGQAFKHLSQSVQSFLGETALEPENEEDFFVLLLGLAAMSSYLKNTVQLLLETHYPDLNAEKTREEQEKKEEAKRQKAEQKAEAKRQKAEQKPEKQEKLEKQEKPEKKEKESSEASDSLAEAREGEAT